MDKGKYIDYCQEVISMEEYLMKRKEMKENENKISKHNNGGEKTFMYMYWEMC